MKGINTYISLLPTNGKKNNMQSKKMWACKRLWPPAYEQLGQQSLQRDKWILIFPGALIKDLGINDPIPH